MKYKIDLNAPIIPGHGAAGLTLGIKKSEIDKYDLDSFKSKEIVNEYVLTKDKSFEYWTNDIVLFFTNNELTQICLTGNYKGKLDSDLGLGDLVKDFEKIYGQFEEGIEDELIYSNLKGLCFECDYSKFKSDNLRDISFLPVAEIYIFKDE